MKVLTALLILLSLTACSKPSSSSNDSGQTQTSGTGQSQTTPRPRNGGTDVGDGGKSRPSNVNEIREAIKFLKAHVQMAFNRLYNFQGPIKDARIRGIVETMVRNNLQDLRNDFSSKYILDADEACPHIEPNHKQASTMKGVMKSTICFHAEQLKELATESLLTQLTALAAHEHAHHFGYDEEDAKALQNYFLEDGKAIIHPNLFLSGFTVPLTRMQTIATNLNDNLDGATELEICRRLSSLEELGAQAESFTADAEAQAENFGINLMKGAHAHFEAKFVYFDALSLASFCGPVDASSEFNESVAEKTLHIAPVKSADKAELKIGLGKLLESIRVAKSILGASADPFEGL